MIALIPNLNPQGLKHKSIRYARRFALVRMRSSSFVNPGGRALVFFFLKPRRLAGTCSKYGSSSPNLFAMFSLKNFFAAHFATVLVMAADDALALWDCLWTIRNCSARQPNEVTLCRLVEESWNDARSWNAQDLYGRREAQ
jgi:hypothetical protein